MLVVKVLTVIAAISVMAFVVVFAQYSTNVEDVEAMTFPVTPGDSSYQTRSQFGAELFTGATVESNRPIKVSYSTSSDAAL